MIHEDELEDKGEDEGRNTLRQSVPLNEHESGCFGHKLNVTNSIGQFDCSKM